MANKQEKIDTKPPSGLGIERDGNKFTFKWKISGDNYGAGQQLQYRLKKESKWTDWAKVGDSVDIGKKTTAKSITINLSNYYPKADAPTLNQIAFRVRGKKSDYTEKSVDYKPQWSDWASKAVKLTEPSLPSLKADLTSANTTKFTWNYINDTKSKSPFNRVQWQSVLVTESNVSDGSKITFNSKQKGWMTGTGTASSNKSIIETNLNPSKSQTRWFRVWSQGCSGNSKNKSGERVYAYAKHVYAKPNAASVTSFSTKSKSTGYDCIVNFKVATTNKNPIDMVVVQYKKAVPTSNLRIPEDIDSGWTNCPDMNVAAKDKTYSTAFTIEGKLSDDECAYVRIMTYHDDYSVASAPYLLFTGKLKKPTSVSVDTTNYPSVTISADNDSDVPGSFLAACVQTSTAPNKIKTIGKLTNGTLTVNLTKYVGSAAKTTIRVGVFARVEKQVTQIGVTTTRQINSDTDWKVGSVPVPPGNVTAALDADGSILVSWDWTWDDANQAELSWSEYQDAWMSTREPETYLIDAAHTTRWKISDVDIGNVWYIRVRLIKEDDDGTTRSDWSEIADPATVNMTYVPETPILNLSDDVILEGQDFSAYWQYYNEDESPQGSATVEVLGENEKVIKKADTVTAQTVVFDSDGMTAGETYTVRLKVCSDKGVWSEYSEPRTIKVAEVLEQPEITYSNAFGNVTVSDDDDEETTETVFSLKELPCALNVSGDGMKQIVIERTDPYHVDRPDGDVFNGYEGETVYISQPYMEGQYRLTEDTQVQYETDSFTDTFIGDGHAYKFQLTYMPYTSTAVTEVELNGVAYADYTFTGYGFYTDGAIPRNSVLTVTYDYLISKKTYYTKSGDDYTAVDAGYSANPVSEGWYETHDGTVTINQEDLLIPLDDGARYRVYVTLTDEYGQMADNELPFAVHWTHQAIPPVDSDDNVKWEASEEIVDGCAVISTTVPVGIATGDVCDIYRLSSDKPELIVRSGEFGVDYVDPFPTIGDNGGHRIVYRTFNGDYIDDENRFAWLDLNEDNPSEYSLINFNGEEVRLYYNVDVSHDWSKDFQETKYLGGSVQGDWNAGVSRTGSLGSVAITLLDNEEILKIRRLAAFNGVCNVRTPDGSNFKADVQVSESRSHDNEWIVPSFSFSYTKVDVQDLDGMPYNQYFPEGATGAT